MENSEKCSVLYYISLTDFRNRVGSLGFAFLFRGQDDRSWEDAHTHIDDGVNGTKMSKATGTI